LRTQCYSSKYLLTHQLTLFIHTPFPHTRHPSDASKNRIYHLPPGIERLTKLTTLNLEANNLEHLPHEIFRLVRLKTLNLSKNRINDCPDSICMLTNLKVLNLEKNRYIYLYFCE